MLLPFSDYRVSFDSISIVDPVYTFPLIIGLVISLWKYKKTSLRRSWPNGIGILVSSIYLLFTLMHKSQVENKVASILKSERVSFTQLKSIPESVANIEWYGVARNATHLYLVKQSTFYTIDTKVDSFPINTHLLDGLDEELVYKMKWFAQDFYTVAENDGKIRVYNMQCDMQGVRSFGDYKAPTAFYYEVTPTEDSYILTSGMHTDNSAIH